jgi:hypothetical protein
MAGEIVERILRDSGNDELLEILAERLAPTDLQSLLMEVYRRRAGRQTAATLLEQYQRNRFVRPSPVPPRVLLEFDRLAFSLAAPAFEPIELGPVCPLGTNSAVAPVDQHWSVATVRNTEVVSDATNVLALECAVRRRALLQSAAGTTERVRLCTSHRLLRPQRVDRPGFFAHFRLFGLCTAGRDEGSYRFEIASLVEQIGFYLELMAVSGEIGCPMRQPRVALTDWTGGTHREKLRVDVIEALAERFPGAALDFYPTREMGRGYYEGVCFKIYARDAAGVEQELTDGGFTPWTQRLMSNRKERLLISGIGTERVCSLFRSGDAGDGITI